MKKQMALAAITLMCAMSLQAAALPSTVATVGEKAAVSAPLKPSATQANAALWSSRVLSRYHYKPMALDEAMSARIFARYFDTLDGEKLFFVRADIDQFAAVRNRLGEAIANENLSAPFAIYNLYQRRFNERIAYARTLLKTTPDFSVDESFQFDREKAAWVVSEAEIRDLWRKRVKNDWLRLKLVGKDEKAIRATLDKRYDSYLRGAAKTNSDDVFEIFMDAYATTIEPHTNYFGPRSAEAFDVAMRLSVEGVGLILQTRDESTVIREILPGPAALSNKLRVGDRIVGIGQDAAGPITEVLGWRLDDVVAQIRGARNSTVRLDVLPADAGPDGKHLILPLVRKKITMEQQSAKKAIVEVREGGVKRRIGVLSLPSFYEDFDGRRKGERDYKSASRDVARLLDEFKKDNVDNLLIDLRDNGGGSLQEAVDLTGLFIDKGPVVQQRNAEGKITIESDTKAGLAWDRPVGVLINRGSASASEIFAAAIQDYGRGLIIGEASFGKGTVQTLVDLDHFGDDKKAHLGELKMTIAQFFRINGGTTQLRGVTPDIKLPALADSDAFGESSYDNALPWTSIKAAPFVAAGNLSRIMPLLDKKHAQRVAGDQDYQFLQQDIDRARKLRKENQVSLNEAVRRKERDSEEARAKRREQRSGHADDGLQGDERTLKAELAQESAAKNAKDVLLNEAVHIMADEAGLLANSKGAAGKG